MSETKLTRLNKVLREFNISLDRAVEFLSANGHEIEARPTTKISSEQYDLFLNEFSSDKSSKVESHDLSEEKRKISAELCSFCTQYSIFFVSSLPVNPRHSH